MIVDDEEASRYGMRRALTTFGYSVSEADSAEAARILVKQQEPDLLLLDVNLPGMSGLDFLRELRSAKDNGNENVSGDGNRSGPLVIIITAHGSERMAVDAVKSELTTICRSRLSWMSCGLWSKMPQRQLHSDARMFHCDAGLRSKHRSVAR